MTVRELTYREAQNCTSLNLKSMFALPDFAKILSMQRPVHYLVVQTSSNDFFVPVMIDSFLFKGIRLYNRALSFSPPQSSKELIKHEELTVCLNELAKYMLRVYGCREISIIQYPHDPPVLNDLSRANGWSFMDEGYDSDINFGVNLSDIYFNMEKRHRYTLRKISRLDDKRVIELTPESLADIGYQLKIGNTAENIKDYYALWMLTFQKMRNQLSKERIENVAESFKFETYSSSLDRLYPKGLCEILMLYQNNTPVCGAILYLSNQYLPIKIGYWSAGAATADAKKLGAPLLLQWMIIKYLKNNGYSNYYLGGIDLDSAKSGPTLFKLGFRGQIVKGKRALYRDKFLGQLYESGKNLYSLWHSK